MSLIRLEGVKKEYPLGRLVVSALNGIDLVVERGEFLAIAGPSGSGKTTLLNLVSGIEKPTSGRILVEETDLSLLSPNQLAGLRANRIGLIFQNFNLLPVLTALENVEYPLLSRKIPLREKRRLAKNALLDVGLAQFEQHKPMELSGGQRQRVAIARAIVMEPAVILADEPTANLDHQTGEDILNLMKKINQGLRTTFIFSTHDHKVIGMANRVVRLWDGVVTKE